MSAIQDFVAQSRLPDPITQLSELILTCCTLFRRQDLYFVVVALTIGSEHSECRLALAAREPEILTAATVVLVYAAVENAKGVTKCTF